VTTNPKHGMAWASLGSLYKQKKDLAKSIDAYEHATALIVKDPILWSNLGTAYANSNPPRLDDAERALQTACHLDPKNADVRAYLGTVERKKNDYPKAIKNLEIAVQLKPDNADWQHNLGVAYRYANRDDDAIAAFQKAITLAPDEAAFHFDLGVAYRRKKDPDHAIPEYEKATSLSPDNADGWFDLGFMYKENHENDKAIVAFKHYLDLKSASDPDGAKRITEECQALGGDCGKPAKTKAPKKSK
jgi:cytochrome c-type biogenesis protein CcmH/NrfG